MTFIWEDMYLHGPSHSGSNVPDISESRILLRFSHVVKIPGVANYTGLIYYYMALTRHVSSISWVRG